jgi:hypothetical protein
MRRRCVKWCLIVVAGTLILAGCRVLGGARARMPAPVATSDTQPTFPPTFTPPPSATSDLTPTPTTTLTPTITLTLTPTPEATSTLTSTVIPTTTPTWTPDLSTPTPGGPVGTDMPATPDIEQPAVSGCSGTFSGDNLLFNPGFEEGQYLQNGDPALGVPEGWAGFWLPEGSPVEHDPDNPDGYLRPSMQVIQAEPLFSNPPRVYNGKQAFHLFGGNRVFDGGIYQQVQVGPGDVLCLSGFAHAWSSHEAGDPARSRLDTEDDRQNVSFLLGIDPKGGTSPWGTNVVWGEVGHLYDTYQAIPSLEVKAQSQTITVFVRGSVLWRFDHNDLFFDDISLLARSPF